MHLTITPAQYKKLNEMGRKVDGGHFFHPFMTEVNHDSEQKTYGLQELPIL